MDNVIIDNYGGVYKRASKVKPYTPYPKDRVETVGDGGSSETETSHQYWTGRKRWDLSKNVQGFAGEFKMGVDIIYSRRAYRQPERCIKEFTQFKRRIKEMIGHGEHYIFALEYGETATLADDMFADVREFTTSSVTPHYHGLITTVLTDQQKTTLEHLVSECWLFDSINFDALTDEQARRDYVCKQSKWKKTKTGKITKCLVKSDYPSLAWQDIPLPVAPKSEGYLSLVKGFSFAVESDLLQLLAGNQYAYYTKSPLRTKCKIKDGDVIGFGDIDWDSYKKVELWYALRRYAVQSLIYQELDYSRMVKKLQSHYTICTIYTNVGHSDIAGTFKHFDNGLLEIDQIPDRKTDRTLYDWSEWLKIKNRWHDLRQHGVSADDGGEMSLEDFGLQMSLEVDDDNADVVNRVIDAI